VNAAQQVLVWGLRLYRWVLSPLKTVVFGPLGRCRFEPSCSAYALEAVTVHGAVRGSWLAIKRLSRCHPWGGAGRDPVPEAGAGKRAG
jgi:putative membrane protein insertion efficiency factor